MNTNPFHQLKTALQTAGALTDQSLKEIERISLQNEEMREALSDAANDIRQWMQLAERHRQALGDKAEFTPYCPSQIGLTASEKILIRIAQALQGYSK